MLQSSYLWCWNSSQKGTPLECEYHLEKLSSNVLRDETAESQLILDSFIRVEATQICDILYV